MIGIFGPFSLNDFGNERDAQIAVIEMMITSGFLTEESLTAMAKEAGEDVESDKFKHLIKTFRDAEKVVRLKRSLSGLILMSMIGNIGKELTQRGETLPHLHICTECNTTWTHTRINIVDYDRAHNCPNMYTDKKCKGGGRYAVPMEDVKPGYKPDFVDWNGQENPNDGRDSKVVH